MSKQNPVHDTLTTARALVTSLEELSATLEDAVTLEDICAVLTAKTLMGYTTEVREMLK